MFGHSEQLVDGAVKYRMHEERIEFTQRHEDKPAMVHARMRHYEIWFVDNPLAVEQDV